MPGFRFITDKSPLPTTRAVERAVGYTNLPDLTAPVDLGTIPAGTRFARIAVSGAAVRYRDDGTDPTADLGMPLQAGETLDYMGNPRAIRFVGQAAGAELDVSFIGFMQS